jgi:dTDP-4-dehydrorhamnose 3,5-epimerase-like enzyme
LETKEDGLPAPIAKNEFRGIGFVKEWVQINHSFSKDAGTLTGMHYQRWKTDFILNP